jgi:hypothetical protein
MSVPVLSGVVYELFSSDVEEVDRPGAEIEHTIDREIRLELSNGDFRYISWSTQPVQSCIAVKASSFFSAGETVLRDFTNHPIWRNLVGKAVSFLVLDPEHQVLEVRSTGGSVYLSSKEGGFWHSDVVTVSAHRPEEIGVDVLPVA